MNKKSTDSKLEESLKKLEAALKNEKLLFDDDVYFAGVIKYFEVALEYAWKFMKHEVNKQGFEAYSPRESIKLAGQIKLIDDVEKWLDFLEDRNLSVHDYLGVPETEYLELIRDFVLHAKRLVRR
ncbi:MAG: nucleotidyltransferase substrate binding protein [Deltaproteobacteria bacterium]|nr:nucleotidyltransferase substrate binding protein [Deltaproteobacteria bacterium]